MPLSDAERKYNSLLAESKQWLAARHVAQQAIDDLIHTPSFDARVINSDEGERLFGLKSPAQQEWMAAECGFMTHEEEQDWHVAVGDKLHREESVAIDDSGASIQLREDEEMSAAYLQYLLDKKTKIGNCESNRLRAFRLEALPDLISLDAAERASLANG